MKPLRTLLLMSFFLTAATSAFAGEYAENIWRNFGRGLHNTLFSWMEIPITIDEYHRGEGRPVIRHVAGFVDGMFQTVVRLGSGTWDFVAAFLPGHQEGMPPNPEYLF